VRVIELRCREESQVECEEDGVWLVGGEGCAEEDDDDVEDGCGEDEDQEEGEESGLEYMLVYSQEWCRLMTYHYFGPDILRWLRWLLLLTGL